jgi:hypothetical protein
MRIAQINLPVFDNNGVNLDAAHVALANDLITLFGGFTVWQGRGAWADNGKLYYEYEPDHVIRETIRAVAKRIGRQAGQLAMFIVMDGESEIIEIA